MKNLLNLGKALNKAEQKNVFGGTKLTHEGDPCHVLEGNKLPGQCPCSSNLDCASGQCYNPAPWLNAVCF